MILIHIPKTAGQSFLYSSKARSFFHQPLKSLTNEQTAGQTIVTTTRNPYDRAASIHYYLRQLHSNAPFETGNFYTDINFFWHKIHAENRISTTYLRPQMHFLSEPNNVGVSDRINHILRFESLEADYALLAKLHNLNVLKKRNVSKYRPSTPWQDELTEESIAKIGELYAEDFERLNYERLI